MFKSIIRGCNSVRVGETFMTERGHVYIKISGRKCQRIR